MVGSPLFAASCPPLTFLMDDFLIHADHADHWVPTGRGLIQPPRAGRSRTIHAEQIALQARDQRISESQISERSPTIFDCAHGASACWRLPIDAGDEPIENHRRSPGLTRRWVANALSVAVLAA
jgi:hypothetical protein